MSNRVLVMDALKASSGLVALIGVEGFFVASDVKVVPPRPFIIVRMHNAYRYQTDGKRDMLQIWFHDEPGDYTQIDQMMELARTAIETIPQVGNFLEGTWFEDSVDLKDDDMHTICRNARYQLTSVTERVHP